MHLRVLFRRRPAVVVAMWLLAAPLLSAADNPSLTKEQIKDFLRSDKIVSARESAKGITHPARLTLSDGKITHDASFQAIDEHKSSLQLASGRVEMNFVDSYKYNIAAYTLAEMLGIDNMLPVYVERKYQGN